MSGLLLFLAASAPLLQEPEDLAGLLAQDGPSLRIFADLGASLEKGADGGRGGSFAFGSLDFLVNQWFGEDLHVLSETVAEGEGTDDLVLDQERLWFAWDRSEALRLTFGLDHLGLSRWNRLYHHGKWLELSIERPFLARFEDDGGVLANHGMGLWLEGEVPAAGSLEYLLSLTNGRGPEQEDRQRLGDANDAKAVEARLAWSPDALTGLQGGAGLRLDDIPADPARPARAAQMDETGVSAFLAYEDEDWTFLGEGVFLLHEDGLSGRSFRSRLAYLQAGRKLGAWTPYARLDYRAMAARDPFYLPGDLDLDATEILLGLRHDLDEGPALKLEVGTGRAQIRSSPAAPLTRDSFTRVSFQVAWTF